MNPKKNCHQLSPEKGLKPAPSGSRNGLLRAISRSGVSGGMKVGESWRFEIPFSSVGFSSHPSP
jgi:hypothetical protein